MYKKTRQYLQLSVPDEGVSALCRIEYTWRRSVHSWILVDYDLLDVVSWYDEVNEVDFVPDTKSAGEYRYTLEEAFHYSKATCERLEEASIPPVAFSVVGDRSTWGEP